MIDERLNLVDWRRRMSELYSAVRADPDPKHAWSRWKATREQLFVDHPESPLLRNERDLEHVPAYYDYDPSYRCVATVTEGGSGQKITVPASINDDGYRLLDAGTAHMELGGNPVQLHLLWFEDYAGGLMLMFRDNTSASETYGAGRYVIDTAKGADLGMSGGGIVLDFNFAYQPSCSYDPHWSCPLPPRENWLDVSVRAGERLRSF